MNNLTTSEKIEKLQSEIQRLREEESSKGIEVYQYLVGKYLHRAATSWEKITAIDRVDEDMEITFDCVSIYYDDRDGKNEDCSINNRSYGSIDSEDIQRYEITKEKFDKIFDKAIKRIKESI